MFFELRLFYFFNDLGGPGEDLAAPGVDLGALGADVGALGADLGAPGVDFGVLNTLNVKQPKMLKKLKAPTGKTNLFLKRLTAW